MKKKRKYIKIFSENIREKHSNYCFTCKKITRHITVQTRPNNQGKVIQFLKCTCCTNSSFKCVLKIIKRHENVKIKKKPEVKDEKK